MTDIPEYMMKDADNCFKSILNIEMDRNEMVAVIARALMEARDKALEDAAVMIRQRFVGVVPGWIEDDIRAMKSSARQDAGIDKPEMSE
ncbi:MAG: hypothetical protein WC829_01790 [Hyphomicrobium sp.]|jgi:hypothetical protein